MALFRGIARLMLDAERKNPRHRLRPGVYRRTLRRRQRVSRCSTNWTSTMSQATGLSLTEIEQLAETMMSSKRTVLCWAMGWTQHRHSVATIGEGANVLLLRGMISKPGAGLCPVRGHSNVQGDRTMGIFEDARIPSSARWTKGSASTAPRARIRHRPRHRCDERSSSARVHPEWWQSRIRRTRRPRGTPGARLPAGRLRHSARKRRGLLSNQPADPAGSVARKSNTPVSQAVMVHSNQSAPPLVEHRRRQRPHWLM